jgi:cell fate regulator YaaT (PSP1 superfamily)
MDDAEVSEGDRFPKDERASGGNRGTTQYVVRCGVMRMLCLVESRQSFRYGQRVICRTPRGVELGEVLSEATPQAMKFLADPIPGSIVRRVTDQDEQELVRLQSVHAEDHAICQRNIAQLQLQMQVVDIERLFGGERVVIYYLADQRVDFRTLVRQLAAELKTRVEMRQIGVRDEAKLLADYGDCGKPVCCNTHLTQMPPVSMRMAKLQKATLDPAKISGRCGRLKCCLRYEYETYDELQRDLPSPGSQVVIESGRATVLHQEILSQQLLVQTEDNRRILVGAKDILSVTRRSGGGKPGQATANLEDFSEDQ